MNHWQIVYWLAGSAAAIAAAYLLLVVAIAAAMRQTPARFGRIMRHVPEPVVWSVVPGPRIWMWARQGTLKAGDMAPDFTLPTHDRCAEVTLSSSRGRRPVVLVFGSYT